MLWEHTQRDSSPCLDLLLVLKSTIEYEQNVPGSPGQIRGSTMSSFPRGKKELERIDFASERVNSFGSLLICQPKLAAALKISR